MVLYFVLFVISVVTFLFAIRRYIYGNDDYWPNRGIPWVSGGEMAPLFDRLLFRLPMHQLDRVAYDIFKRREKVKFGGVMEFRRPLVFLVDMDLVKSVMVKDFDHFTNRRAFGNEYDLFKKTLFSMDNPPWKDTRSAMSPTFTTGKIKRMFGIFSESSHKLTEFLKNELKHSNEIEMRDVCGRYTMDVIASAAFGLDSQNFKDANSSFAQMGNRIQKQFTGLGLVKVFINFLFPDIGKLLRLKVLDHTAQEFFSDVVKKAIQHREQTGEKRNDFLQLLMDSRSGELAADDEDQTDDLLSKSKEPKSKSPKFVFTDELIVAQCVLFFLAGFDTTETLLTFAAYELALNPDVQERLAKDIKTEVEKDGGELTYEAVNRLEYLDMVISETLRKYPPVVRTDRRCTKNYVIPDTNYEIKKDQLVVVPVWAIHHDPDIYPDPEKFIPDRFNKECKAERNQYAWMPFGLGPRNCIAMRFALTEGKAAIAHLIQNFEIQPCSKSPIPLKYMTNGTMKPEDGMWLKVSPRK